MMASGLVAKMVSIKKTPSLRPWLSSAESRDHKHVTFFGSEIIKYGRQILPSFEQVTGHPCGTRSNVNICVDIHRLLLALRQRAMA